MLKLEVRPQPSKLMSMASPLLALLITVLIIVAAILRVVDIRKEL
jgi:simple sugar transport system permease protein